MKRKIIKNMMLFFIICTILLYVLLNKNNIIIETIMPYDKEKIIELGSVDIEILEDGEIVSEGNILEWVNEDFKIGQIYTQEIASKNTGTATQYVRVIIYRSWTNENGVKDTSLDPEMIELDKSTEEWLWDENSETPERMVAYYKYPVASEEQTTPCINSIRISSDVQYEYEKIIDGDNLTLQNRYNNKLFEISVEFDAIQASSVVEAMKEEWKVDVTLSGDEIVAVN